MQTTYSMLDVKKNHHTVIVSARLRLFNILIWLWTTTKAKITEAETSGVCIRGKPIFTLLKCVREKRDEGELQEVKIWGIGGLFFYENYKP